MTSFSKSDIHGAIHAACFEQIPWLVNGSLEAEESERYVRHIAECETCAQELNAQSALHERVNACDPLLIAPQGAWQKMSQRLDREDEAMARSDFSLAASSKRLRWTLAVQYGVIAALFATTAYLWQGQHNDTANALQAANQESMQPRYHVLTATGSDMAPYSGAWVRVVLRKDLSVGEMNSLMLQHHLAIVSGPSEAGVLNLAKAGQIESHAVATLLAELRVDGRVVFAEPAEPGGLPRN